MEKTLSKRLNFKLGTYAFALVFALGSLVVVLPSTALAFDGITTGQVATIETGPGGIPDGFVLRLVGTPPLCTGSQPGVAYLATRYGDSFEWVKMNLALVLAAKLSATIVTVYANNNADGTCRIAALDFSP